MIKLNNKIYSKLSYQVSFGDYQVKQNGKKRLGKAPYITFILDDFELGWFLHLVTDYLFFDECFSKEYLLENSYFNVLPSLMKKLKTHKF